MAKVYGTLYGDIGGIKYLPNGGNINNPNEYIQLPKLAPEELLTLELGYKGNISSKLLIDFDMYVSNANNFISSAIALPGRIVSTGTRDINPSELTTPGTVNSSGILSNASFLSYLNYGQVVIWGGDINVTYHFSQSISSSFKYSYFNSDITKDNIKNDANRDGYIALDEKSLNAPQHSIQFNTFIKKFFTPKISFEFNARWLPQYDFFSGTQIAAKESAGGQGVVYGGINPLNIQIRNYYKGYNWGPLGGFVDLGVSWSYKVNKSLSLQFSISNLLNNPLHEFITAPFTRRLMLLEAKWDIL